MEVYIVNEVTTTTHSATKQVCFAEYYEAYEYIKQTIAEIEHKYHPDDPLTNINLPFRHDAYRFYEADFDKHTHYIIELSVMKVQ